MHLVLRLFCVALASGCIGTVHTESDLERSTDSDAPNDDSDESNDGDDDDSSDADGGDPGPPPPGQPVPLQCSGTPSAAPSATWTNVTHNLAGMASECGNLTLIAADPCSNRVIAGVARQGLFETTNGGGTWTHIGTSGDTVLHRPTIITYDPEHPGTFYEAGIYGWEDPWSQGVFKTTNNGASFTGYLNLSLIQSSQDAVSIDFHDPERLTMAAGGHEQTKIFWVSSDAGANWRDVGDAFPDNVGFCTTTLVLSQDTLLVGCAASWSGKAGAILRTTNGGNSFTTVYEQGVVGHPLWASDGTLYWASEPGVIVKSTDLGQHWAPVASGAKMQPIELPDGRLMSRNDTHIVVGPAGGASWTEVLAAVPAQAGFTYSARTKTVFTWRNDCGNSVLSDAIWAAGWDYTAP